MDNGGQTGTNTALSSVPTGVALIVKNGAALSPTGSQTVGTLLVASNGWVVSPSGQTVASTLTVTGNATVQAGGGIIADGRGYAGGSGPGAGKYYSTSYENIGGGGGYGGYGASGGGTTSAYGGITYGSVTAPVDLGSGGGGNNSSQLPPTAGGAGGGAIRLSVTGTLQVDGRISARGLAGTGPSAGGGSGGSLYLTVGTLAGSGSIDASGGAGNALGGGGGGGRIGVIYSVNSFAGLVSASGGGGYARGGAGTVYTKASNQNGLVVVDNGGQAGTNTSWLSTGVLDLTVKGGAILSLPNSSITIGNLLVASNGWVATTIPGVGYRTLTVTGNATIQAGGGIIADATGNDSDAGGAGPSPGSYISTQNGYVSGGGGYGGCGATSGGNPAARGGNAFGNLTVPTFGSNGGGFGSGFVGGPGGGLIALNVTGTLDVDGRISAAGGAGVSVNAGGGSGGGINLTVGTLSGSGVIAANGGAGNGLGGGGGGGRIAIVFAVNAFSGLVSAYGGGGYAWGGAGTVYTKANSQSWGQVLVDNGGRAGTNTTWASSGTIDLTVTGAAVVSPPLGSQAFGNLLVASNGWLSVSTQILTVSSNATIRAGGGILADRTGNAAGLGTGAGKYVSTSSGYVGGGGGYGGYGAAGGAPSGYLAYGGSPYGSVTTPVDLGSGGGNYAPSAIGGAGGGAVRLSVTGLLQVDGLISAAGGPGITPSAGGGSGGTVSLTAGTLAGSGVIAANGGAGNSLGGGGGGGRIALVYGVYNFAGVVSAYGGSGYASGGAGTIYSRANGQNLGQVIADNGGQAGTNTTLGSASTGTIDLTVKNGAVFTPPTTQVFGTVLVASNGWMVMPTSQAGFSTLTVTGSATVQAGGGIIADGLGYAGGSGPGAGKVYTSSYAYIGGGGGYGGYGASGGGNTPAYGGITYGSAASPTEFGSGGGGNGYVIITSQPPLAGGAGGGAIRLSVTGTLQVDGRISARGLGGTGPSAGGGAGGSINLTVGALTGSGVISADGGAGNALGGGGGGGRIAVSFKGPNNFSGLISAYGGGGYATGGAGTIYFPSYYDLNGSYGLAVVDNGGQTGTNTGWSGLGSSSALTVSGGAVVAPSGSQSIGNLVVASNAWIVFTSSQGSVPTLTITGNATVQAGGGIIADGTGYSQSNGGIGPGGGSYYSTSIGYVSGGGGNGGYGATSGGSPAARGGNTVGSLTIPSVGSAGGTYSSSFVSGPGGGGINLNVRGALQVDGRISAAGGAGVSANAGGGAGGGINLSVGTLAGSGVIAANGGAGNGLGGGGGGGRIAITYTTSAFSGLLSAFGGGGYAWGGAGTIYTKAGRQSWGQVLVDNGGRAGTNTSWLSTSTIDLTVMGGAVVAPPSQQTMGNLLVASNGWMSLSTQMLTVTSNATVQAGGGIVADSTGYAAGAGQGAGASASGPFGWIGGGGGFGGYGAAGGTPASYYPASGGGTYGSMTGPVDRGSGGGYSPNTLGGAGGGAVRLNVTGSLLVNGRISANGGDGIAQGSGGGSGGSVWLTVGTLAGAGVISANGGTGNELGGGGGGGRISLQYALNAFEGAASAYGGGGYAWGGAGTVYTKANSQATGQMLVDNGGHHGTNTPLPYVVPESAFSLTIRDGAVAYPLAPSLLLSNLVIASGGTFACLPKQTSLDLAVLGNATIDAGGLILADGKGFAARSGLGAGFSTNSIGSGAGYGGNGGASSLFPGGGTYGSAQEPVDFGSGGGAGSGTATGGSEGGGAIHLTVGGTLTMNGRVSAGGNDGLQDDAGGGSGGSIWLAAATLAGSGTIAADGGAGELYNGGGGGGGRIAICTPFDVFNGVVSAAGGAGFSPGQTGSVYYAATLEAPRVVSSWPAGVLTSGVSFADITFSTPVNPFSVVPPTVALAAPGGLAVSNLTIFTLSPYQYQISFPTQTAQGEYALTVSPQVWDLLGQPMSQAYTGTFTIAWATLQGTITDTNGQPVPDVVLQPDGGILATTTDTNGNYVLDLPPAGIVHVVPLKAGLMFVPGSRSYTNVTLSITNQNYLAVSTVLPSLTTQVQSNNFILSWNGISGVTYQLLYSTNLVDWLPYADALPGTNGTMQVQMPMDTSPVLFFRVGAGN